MVLSTMSAVIGRWLGGVPGQHIQKSACKNQEHNIVHIPSWPMIGCADKGLAILERGYFSCGPHRLAHDCAPPWKQDLSLSWQNYIHRFEWIGDLLATKQPYGLHLAVACLQDWLDRYGHNSPPSRGQLPIWQGDVVAKRLRIWLSFAAHMDAIQPEELDKNLFYHSLALQAAFLRKQVIKSSASGHKRPNSYLLQLLGCCITSFCFTSERNYNAILLQLLARAIDEEFIENAIHYRHNAGYQLTLLLEMMVLRDLMAIDGQGVHILTRDLMRRLSEFVQFMAVSESRLAGFHGCLAKADWPLQNLIKYGIKLGEEIPSRKAVCNGFYRMQSGDFLVIADFAQRAQKEGGGAVPNPYQGALSFECFYQGHPIIVNCGITDDMSPQWQQVGRQPEAHSTLTMVGEGDSKKKRSFLRRNPASVFAKKPAEIISFLTHEGMVLEGENTFFVKTHHIVHRRRLVLNRCGSILRGEEWIVPHGGKGLRTEQFILRFHCHPKIQISRLEGGSYILLLSDGNINEERWIMTCSCRETHLAESVYAAEGGIIQKTQQILVKGRVLDNDVKVRWTLQKVNAAQE